MSDQIEPQASQSPVYNRRQSDQLGRDVGAQAGGRRQNDQSRALPRGKKARLAIAASFLFSTCLVIWSFSMPFRSGSLGHEERLKNLPEAELASLEYEAKLSAQAYVDYTRDLDRRLLDRVQDKYRVATPPKTRTELVKKWEKGIERRKQQLREMEQELGEETFKKGTIEWQNQQDLEKILGDAPPGA